MNKRKLTDYSVLASDTPTKLKKQQKNLLGYLKYRYIGHSEYRYNNDDWFYVSNVELLNETGIGSKQTLYVYLNLFIEDGIIEKQTGDRHHSNMYRFTPKYRDSKFDYVPIQNRTTKQVDNETTNEKIVPPLEVESVPPEYRDSKFDYVPLQNRTTKQIDNETTNEKIVPPLEVESVPPVFEQNRTTDTDKDKDKEKDKENISDLMNNEKIEKKMLKEKNEELEKVKASIERYIAKATDLTDEQIWQYNNFYINRLKQCTTNDEAQYLASWMVSKMQKARTPKQIKVEQPKPQQTDNDGKITPVKPYDNMLTDLPKPKDVALYIDGEKDNLLNQFRTYCQNASNHLFYEQNNPKYQPKVKSHWYWYLNDLFTNYAPILVQAGIDKDIDNAQEHICHIWNNNSSFNIQDLTKAL